MANETSSTSMYDTESLSVGDDSESDETPDTLPKWRRLTTIKVRPRSGKFKKGWSMPYIVASSKGDKYAYCKLCNSNFSVSHGGRNDAQRHCQSSGHLKRYAESQSALSITSRFRGESSASHFSKVMAAELMMAKFIALHNLPFQVADHLTDLVPLMFPDSKIAAGFASKHTKTKSIVCDAIDPHLKEPVIKELKCNSFNLMCDESNERGDHCKLLTILVRLYDRSTQTVATRHLETVGTANFTAEGLFTYLTESLARHDIPIANVMSFTSDTCNVMKGARGGVIAKLRSVQPRILDVHCICHLVSLCLKSAVKSLPLKVDDLLVDIYYHFRNSVNRITSLQEFAEFCCVEYKRVLKHCETRWLSLRTAIDSIIQMWDPLLSYFTSHEDVEKPGKVRTIFIILNQPTTKLWLLFLSNVLPVFDRFNVLFQTSSTSTVHRLHEESVRLLKTVLGFFIKPDVIRKYSDDLTKLNIKNTSNHLPSEEIFLGDSTTALFIDLNENEGEGGTRQCL